MNTNKFYYDYLKGMHEEGFPIMIYNPVSAQWEDIDNPDWESESIYRIKEENRIDLINKEYSEKYVVEYYDPEYKQWVEKDERKKFDNNLYYRVREIHKDEFDDFAIAKDIAEVLVNFDFNRVYKVMTVLDWTWWDTHGVPSKEQIRKFAHDLMVDCIKCAKETKSETYSIASGGFEVRTTKDTETNKLYFSLRFVLTDFDNYD